MVAMAEIGICPPPRTRVLVTSKSRCASAMALANPALTPSSSPSNRKAMAMHKPVRTVRAVVAIAPPKPTEELHTECRLGAPEQNRTPARMLSHNGFHADLYHLSASLFVIGIG